MIEKSTLQLQAELDSLRSATLAEIEQLYAEINDLKDEIKEVKRFKLKFYEVERLDKSL